MSSTKNDPFRKLCEEELQMIETMGGTGFEISEIAEVLEIDNDAFQLAFMDKHSNVYLRFRKGFLQASVKLRQRIFLDAGHGSSPAQTLAKKILDECEFKNFGHAD